MPGDRPKHNIDIKMPCREGDRPAGLRSPIVADILLAKQTILDLHLIVFAIKSTTMQPASDSLANCTIL